MLLGHIFDLLFETIYRHLAIHFWAQRVGIGLIIFMGNSQQWDVQDKGVLGKTLHTSDAILLNESNGNGLGVWRSTDHIFLKCGRG